MKGVVFNILEEIVTRNHGLAVWDEAVRRAEVSGAYTSLGSYDDLELMALVKATAAVTDQNEEALLRWFGREKMRYFIVNHPELPAGYQSTRELLLALNKIIHPEVRKLHPDADVPQFEFDRSHPEELGMIYRSGRRLCILGEGLIQGAAEHFGERVEVRQPRCMLRGAEACEFRIKTIES